MERAVKGSEEFAHEWLGAKWLFVNAEHRELFAADPIKYAPQQGGYCAVGASSGGTRSADPEAWRIPASKSDLAISAVLLNEWIAIYRIISNPRLAESQFLDGSSIEPIFSV